MIHSFRQSNFPSAFSRPLPASSLSASPPTLRPLPPSPPDTFRLSLALASGVIGGGGFSSPLSSLEAYPAEFDEAMELLETHEDRLSFGEEEEGVWERCEALLNA